MYHPPTCLQLLLSSYCMGKCLLLYLHIYELGAYCVFLSYLSICLFFSKKNQCYNFWMVCDRTLIFHMCILCSKTFLWAEPQAQSVALQTWEQEVLVRSKALPIFFPRIDDSLCDRIHFSLTIVRCFDNGYGKAASGLERILLGVLVKSAPGKHR